jgi:hypothetical protein
MKCLSSKFIALLALFSVGVVTYLRSIDLSGIKLIYRLDKTLPYSRITLN